jgi:hypothetical protein
VEARRQEYEADDLAAATVGAAPLADALVRLDLKSRELSESYWPSVYAAADATPTPSSTPYRGLLGPERRGLVPEAAEQLRQALERRTSTADTHPCLRDRLQALGRPAVVPPAPDSSAAAAVFGAKLGVLVKHFDDEWQNGVAEWWRGRHEHVKAGRRKLAEYGARSADTMTDEDLYGYANLLEEFEGAVRAFELYKLLVEQRGATRAAKFAYGRLLLAQGDASGIAHLEDVMRRVPEATLGACDLIVGYLRSHGRDAETQPYIDRYLERRALEEQSRHARETVYVTDRWLPPILSAEALSVLKKKLVQRGDVQEAYVVRKEMPAGTPPLHVVGLRRARRLAIDVRVRRAAKVNELVRWLAANVQLPDEILYVSIDGEQKAFRKVFKKVSGARIV